MGRHIKTRALWLRAIAAATRSVEGLVLVSDLHLR